ncbi:MAG TPA: DUF1622 domain-containing protein [Chitinophagaceae bacterium]
MEEVVKRIADMVSSVVELVAVLVIVLALLHFLYLYARTRFSPGVQKKNAWLRVQFGSSLTVALELLLAADILATAVAPTWDDIGKLAAIAAIRTALNYFLEKELSNMEQRMPESSAPNE